MNDMPLDATPTTNFFFVTKSVISMYLEYRLLERNRHLVMEHEMLHCI
jgi:hypothetical protein